MNKMEEEIKKLKNGDIVREMKDLQKSHMKNIEKGMEKALTQELTKANEKIRNLEKLLNEKEDELTKKENREMKENDPNKYKLLNDMYKLEKQTKTTVTYTKKGYLLTSDIPNRNQNSR